MTQLYFAYGSNLNLAQMARRCPAAERVGKFVLTDARLIFRGVADVIRADGEQCQGGIWKLTPECEAALDRYEGIESGMYRKVYLPITGFGPEHDTLLIYVMNSEGIYPPAQAYLDGIMQGYRDFGLPLKPLKTAVKASWTEKKPSHVERKRTRRTGRPPLGLSETVRESKPTGKAATGNRAAKHGVQK